jgi:gliding motility-associated-like protein
MKQRLIIFLFIVFLANSLFSQNICRERYERYINNHEFSTRQHLTPEQIKKIPKKDRPDLGWEQNFLMTLDPQLGYPPVERLLMVYDYLDSLKANSPRNNNHLRSAISGINWNERGPNNVGGRTRAIMFDPNDATHKKVWAGGVTGGLWYTNDINNQNAVWNKVNDFWDNIAISCIAYDPNNTQIFYVGTGEGFTSGSASTTRGFGIWKTTDGGANWTRLTSTNSFYYVNDLVVRNEGGSSVLYVGLSAKYYQGVWHGDFGLYRSTNGGSSFSQVLPNITSKSYTYAIADIEIGADNRLYLGTVSNPYGDGGGTILYSDNGSTWTTNTTYSGVSGVSRVELACAPSNANYVYGLIEANQICHAFIYSNNKASSFTSMSEPNDADGGIPATDFTRNQAWYNLILAVDPNDEDVVIAGGIDLFKTSDNGNNWTQISHWYGGFGYPYVHADQHAIVFVPGSSDSVMVGNDGGVHYTSNMSNNSPSFIERNKNYNVTQFYAGTINSDPNSNTMIAGSQDNGTQRFLATGTNSTTEITGGDGAFCFIDADDTAYQITSYVYNNYFLSSNNWFNSSTILADDNSGSFINVAAYDSRENILYSAKDVGKLYKITNITGTPNVDSVVASFGSMPSAIKVSPYSTPGSSNIFVGTRSGKIFKVANAHGASPTVTEITGTTFDAGNISCIDIGTSENEILVSFSNYGIKSVWRTTDGGINWNNIEGNLPDMPVRWCLFDPNITTRVILATEVGVWSTNDISVASPNWGTTNSGLANVRVDMLQYRSADNTIMAVTHGRGVFTATLPTVNNFITADFTFDTVCFGSPTSFTHLSISNVKIDSFLWDLDSNGVFNDKKDSIFNFTFSKPDTFWVGLKVMNSNGSDSIYKQVVLYPVPDATFDVDDSVNCPNDTFRFTNNSTISNGTITSYQWTFGDGGISLVQDTDYVYTALGNFEVKMTAISDMGCVDSFKRTMIVSANTVASFIINDSVQCLGVNSFTFTDNSNSCIPVDSFYWDTDNDGAFDDDTGSVITVSFTKADTFFIGLKTFSTSNTDSVYKRVIVLNEGPADFSINDTQQCFNAQNFIFTDVTQACTIIDSILWDLDSSGIFDDAKGNSANSTFGSIGNHYVGMQVFRAGFIDTVYKKVNVLPIPNADFSINNATQTLPANNFVFTDLSSNAISYFWEFGDGDTTSQQNVNHTYSAVGNYSVKLKVQNTLGCYDSIIKVVKVIPSTGVVAVFSSDSVCLGDSSTLTDASLSSDPILTYEWDLDNDSIYNDATGAVLRYRFGTDGSIRVGLRVTTASDADTFYQNVTVFSTPLAGFTINNPNQPLGGNNFVFTNATTINSGTLSYLWSFGDGGNSYAKDTSYSYTAANSYNVKLIATSDKGCVDSFSRAVTVTLQSIKASFTATDGCVGDSVSFTNTSNLANDTVLNYHWDYGDGNVAIVKSNPKHVYYATGSYNVRLIIVTKLGQMDTAYGIANVYANPVVDIIPDGDTIFYKGKSVGLSTNSIFDSIFWSTGETTQSIVADSSGIYSVRVVNADNCDDEDQVEIVVEDFADFKPVDVFTPNGDGINDLWTIEDIDAYRPVVVTVFNRWGDKVFSSNDYRNTWDGKYDGEYLPEGTYYYVVEANGQVYKGMINIIK